MVPGVLSRLYQLVHYVLWGGVIGVADTEVDDVFPFPTFFQLIFIDDVEYVRWESLYSVKIFQGLPLFNR